MSYFTTIPSKINTPKTLLDLFNGKSDIWMSNNSFPVVDMSNIMKQDLYTPREVKGKGKNGISLLSPRIYIKNDKGEFTNRYRIELTNRLKRKETYRFKTPPVEGYKLIDDKYEGKLKNPITVKIIDDEGQTEALIKIDNVICMGLEFLLLATLVKYDFKDVKNDKELIDGLFKAIAPKNFAELHNKLNDEYYNLPQNPPLWEKDENVSGNYNIISNIDKKYLSLFNVIYETELSKVKHESKMNGLQTEIYTNLFNKDKKNNPYYNFLMCGSSNNITPTAKKYVYEIDGQQKEFNDMRLLFYVKHNNSTFNPKFPENLYVHKLARGGVKEPLNGDEFNEMIGLKDFDKTKPYRAYSGFMWVNNHIDLTKFGMFQVHSNWLVNEVILNKSSIQASSTFNIDDDYYNELCDEDTERIAVETTTKVIPSSSTIEDFDDNDGL